MDLMQLGTQLLSEYFGDSVSENSAASALLKLLADGGGNLDIAGLVTKMSANGDLGNIVQSWLNDGANAGIDTSQLTDIFGSGKLDLFAQELGVSESEGKASLANVLPQLIDESSSGGSLLESVGGIGGALDMAKGFFK